MTIDFSFYFYNFIQLCIAFSVQNSFENKEAIDF